MLRDLAARLGKKVEFVMQGEATELDKVESGSKLVVEESAAAAESLKDQSRKPSDVVASFRLAPNSNQNRNPRPVRLQTA